jgi:hypothetical protein
LCCLAFQTTQWPKEGQTTQWPKEGQTTQWPKEGQTTQWPKEGQTTQWLSVLLLLAIVLSGLLRITDSDYPFGIFKLFHVFA